MSLLLGGGLSLGCDPTKDDTLGEGNPRLLHNNPYQNKHYHGVSRHKIARYLMIYIYIYLYIISEYTRISYLETTTSLHTFLQNTQVFLEKSIELPELPYRNRILFRVPGPGDSPRSSSLRWGSQSSQTGILRATPGFHPSPPTRISLLLRIRHKVHGGAGRRFQVPPPISGC